MRSPAQHERGYATVVAGPFRAVPPVARRAHSHRGRGELNNRRTATALRPLRGGGVGIRVAATILEARLVPE